MFSTNAIDLYMDSFFRYCLLNLSRNPLPIRTEDDMFRAPKQSIIKSSILPNGEEREEELELITEYSWRNFFSTINFAKIMQKLSKGRSHRIWMLVQYKSSVSISLAYIPKCILMLVDVGRTKTSSSSKSSTITTSCSEVDQKSSTVLRS